MKEDKYYVLGFVSILLIIYSFLIPIVPPSTPLVPASRIVDTGWMDAAADTSWDPGDPVLLAKNQKDNPLLEPENTTPDETLPPTPDVTPVTLPETLIPSPTDTSIETPSEIPSPEITLLPTETQTPEPTTTETPSLEPPITPDSTVREVTLVPTTPITPEATSTETSSGKEKDPKQKDLILAQETFVPMGGPLPIGTVHNINTYLNYATIQDAIDDSNTTSGDTITVDSGTYGEQVTVTKQLTLRGLDTGGGLPVIDGMQLGSPIAIPAAGAGSTIEYIVVRNSSDNLNFFYAGISIQSDGNVVQHIQSEDNLGPGVFIVGGSDNRLTDIDSAGNGRCCFYLAYASNNIIQQSTGVQCHTNGVTIESGSLNEIISTTLNGNWYDGINLYDTTNTLIYHTIVQGNLEYGISLEASQYASIYDSWFNNTVNTHFAGTNSGNFWNVTLNSGENIIGGSLIGGNYWAAPDGNGFSQVCTDINGNGICDAPYQLDALNTDWLPLTVASGGVVANFTASPTEGPASLSVQFNDTSTGDPTSWYWDFGDGTNSTVRNVTHIYHTPGSYTVKLNASNVAGFDWENKTDFIEVTDQSMISTCTVIDTPGIYTLTTDLMWGVIHDHCINITASDVILDGDGHTINGDSFEFGIITSAPENERLKNITIQNLTLTRWEYSIYLENVESGSIERVNATDSEGFGYAITIYNSTDTRVLHNDITTMLTGITIDFSENVTVDGNNISTRDTGIWVDYSNDVTLLNNTVSSEYYHGIYVQSSPYSSVTTNNISGGGWGGLGVVASENALITGNTAEGDQEGIYLVDSSHASITDNNASGGFSGISMYSSSDGYLGGNTFNDNERGMYLLGSSNTTITDTTALHNTIADFYSDEYSFNNTVVNFTVGGILTPISFSYGNGVLIRGIESAPSDPNGKQNISKYVEITNITENSWINISIGYSDDDLGIVDENTLKLWEFNESMWAEVPGSFTDPLKNLVIANISSFSIFAPLGSVVSSLPLANFTVDITSGSSPLTVQFTDTSNCVDPMEWYWEFGDGNTSSVQNPLYTYTAPNSYSVNFRITNASGSDWYNRTNYINVTADTTPRATFLISKDYSVSTTSDSFVQGTYPSTLQYNINVRNDDDGSDTALGNLEVRVLGSNFQAVSWENYAYWNTTSAQWYFPENMVIGEGDQIGTNIYTPFSEQQTYNVSVTREVTPSSFIESGIQQVNVSINFTNTAFDWAWVHLNTITTDEVSTLLVPGSIWTGDAPVTSIDEQERWAQVNFNKSGIEPGHAYTISYQLMVEPHLYPIVYKPRVAVGFGTYHTSMVGETGQEAVMPSEFLPENITYASITVNTSTQWSLDRNNHLIVELKEDAYPSSPIAALQITNNSVVIGDGNSLQHGSYNGYKRHSLNLENSDDPSDTTLGNLTFGIEADNITGVRWEEYATWDGTSASWVFPETFTVPEGSTFITGIGTSRTEPRYLDFDLSRAMNTTEFDSAGYQHLDISFVLSNVDYNGVWVQVIPLSTSGCNGSIVPGSYTTDAPVRSVDDTPESLNLDLNPHAMQPGKEYHVSCVLQVDPLGYPVTYVPRVLLGENYYFTQVAGGYGTGATVPSTLLPEHVQQASVGTNSSNWWSISRGDNLIAWLGENITVHVPPVASFTADPVLGYTPLTVQFNDTSTGTPTAWNWSFGDGIWFNTTDPVVRNATHRYTSSGTFTVNLTVTNEAGSDSVEKENLLSLVPMDLSGVWNGTLYQDDGGYSSTYRYLLNLTQIGTTVSGTARIEYSSYYGVMQLTGSITNGLFSYTETGFIENHPPPGSVWYLKKGYLSLDGRYPDQLNGTWNVTGAGGYGRISVSRNIEVPAANFTADVTSGPAPLTVQFTDLSTGNPTAWNWNFGDGTTSTEKKPLHTYQNPDIYTVSLNVSNTAGYGTKTVSDLITVIAGPVVSLHFDEGTGSVATDSSGNNRDGIIQGATWVEGINGSALKFDGINDYVELSHPGYLTEGTVEGWIKFDADQSYSYWFSMSVAGMGTHGDSMDFCLHAENSPNLLFGFYQGGWNWADSGIRPVVGEWYHVAGTWGSAGTRIYVNGELKGTNPYSGGIPSSAQYTYLALNSWGVYFNGTIDEVAMYSRALSPAEIQAHYQQYAPVGGDTGFFRVHSNVDGASVYFDQEFKGIIQEGTLLVQVYTAATPYQNVTVTKAGYSTYTESLLGNYPAKDETVDIYALLTPYYYINATAGTGGSITPSGEVMVLSEGDATFTIDPASGYAIDEVLIDEVSNGSLTSYTFEDVLANHTITAQFRYIHTSGGGGDGGGSPAPAAPPEIPAEQPPTAPQESPVIPEVTSGAPSAIPEPEIALVEETHASLDFSLPEGITITMPTPAEQQVTIYPLIVGETVSYEEKPPATPTEEPVTIVTIQQEEMIITLVTQGLTGTPEQGLTGVIESISVETTPVTTTIQDVGQADVYFDVQLATYPEDGTITTTISTPDEATVREFQKIATENNAEIAAILFAIDVTKTNIGATGEATLWATVPKAWVDSQEGGIESIYAIRIGDDGNRELLAAEYVRTETRAVPDTEGNTEFYVFKVVSPHGLSIFGMISAKAKGVAGVVTPAAGATPVVAPMLVPGGVGFATFLVTNPIFIAGVAVIIVVFIYMERKFHIFRREEIRYPESGLPAWEPYIETERQSLYASIIDVLNEVDAQVKELAETLAKPGFILGRAETEPIVDRFFVTCQVAEEKIKKGATDGYLTAEQVAQLHEQLGGAVNRMIDISRQSPVLAELVQVKLGAL